MPAPTYSVRVLDESTWPAFAELVERNGGLVAGCWCMAFHPESAGKGRQGKLNHDRKLTRVRAGTADAALAFHDDQCLGWCQFGSPEQLPRIKSRTAHERGQTTTPDWRIGCCYVSKGLRRQGVAAAALAGALKLIARSGGGVVEGIRRTPTRYPRGSCSTGRCQPTSKWGSPATDRSASTGGS